MQLHLPVHENKSHKGEYGKVLVVGGSSDYYGAPILTALGVEKSGSDLITLCLPSESQEVAKSYSLNFFLRPFEKNILSQNDVKHIMELSKENHVMVIGNGIGKSKGSKLAVIEILSNASIPVVIDAEGLVPEILDIDRTADTIITPHKAEFKRLFGLEASKESVLDKAKEHNLTILVKGQLDIVGDPSGQIYLNETGCPEMRVGGTGDVLAGVVASFIAQGMEPFEASCSAAYYWGKCGELMRKKRKWFSAHDLVEFFPEACNLI